MRFFSISGLIVSGIGAFTGFVTTWHNTCATDPVTKVAVLVTVPMALIAGFLLHVISPK